MKIALFFLITLFGFVGCHGQSSNPPKFYNEDFKWTITIPENFLSVPPKEWEKMQNKGADAIENTFGDSIANRATIIFVFKNGQFNYFESNYQPFDLDTDGDYLESCRGVNEIIYETFQSQMANAKLDSSSTTEKISGLSFQVFKMKVVFPNGITMQSSMYSRLFGKREFSVNILYVDEKQGMKMLEAWRNSKFD